MKKDLGGGLAVDVKTEYAPEKECCLCGDVRPALLIAPTGSAVCFTCADSVAWLVAEAERQRRTS